MINIIRRSVVPVIVFLSLTLALPQTALASGTFRTTDGVNVRSSASTSSNSLTTVAKDTSVDVLEHDPAGWSKVRADGVTGYIRSDFLKVPIGDAPVIFIVTSEVNVRSLASTSSHSLAVIPQGSSVNVLDHDPAGWSKIQAGGYGGYIRSDFLKYSGEAAVSSFSEDDTASGDSTASDDGVASEDSTASEGGVASEGSTASEGSPEASQEPDTIIAQLQTLDGVNMRTGASTSSSVLKVLAGGTVVDVIDNESNGWSKVVHGDTTGYIRSDLLVSKFTPGGQKGGANPLTGESFDAARNPWNNSLNKNRPWIVSIGNTADAMPLWGIEPADILIEFVVESVATRLLAVYQDVSAVGRIGGIRSLRTSSMEIAASFDGIFAHWGGRTYDDVVTSGKPVTDYGTIDASSLGGRDPDKITQNSAIATGSDLINGLPASFRSTHSEGYKSGFTFTDNGTPTNGARADTVTVSFSDRTVKKSKFTYDANLGKYYMSQFGTDLIDGNNNKKLSFTNVLVLQTELQFDRNAIGHTYVKTTGTGTGYFINGGKYVPITWSRGNLSSPYTYHLTDGTPLQLGVGKTYICMVDSNQTPVFS